MTSPAPIDYQAHGFRQTGFGCTVRACEISVHIVITSMGFAGARFGVYLCHGAPAGAFWQSSPPLVDCSSLKEAKQAAATIFGIAGSEQFAVIHDGRGR